MKEKIPTSVHSVRLELTKKLILPCTTRTTYQATGGLKRKIGTPCKCCSRSWCTSTCLVNLNNIVHVLGLFCSWYMKNNWKFDGPSRRILVKSSVVTKPRHKELYYIVTQKTYQVVDNVMTCHRTGYERHNILVLILACVEREKKSR